MPSSPSSRSSSSRLTRAAGAERMALLRERDKLSRRRAAAAEALAAIEEQLGEVEERLELIDRLVPEAANVHPLPARGGAAGDGLKGSAIRRAAIDVLLARPGAADQPIHYKEWFRLLEASGRPVAGKDPLAVFLTQISRSPVVRRTTHSGVYELDLEAPARLRSRLDRLHARLAEQSTDRAERERIVAEIGIAERALDEAERALPARDADRRAAG
ncbi:hypothetical protein Q5424_02860 [Conexibacter sp. JD483]|uniref:hypothetical protein n=1 Tax=unclassified Conexibacter TaxID=2627773 RepID=UPI0027160579|nr:MULTISPECIES: hypothetical protein [unclassified Conexibacter]MDO8185046.1 hypothetical protein [Conexibacter sp. CPCC 205706]MDO8196756.1 hypothetical protein [Conexibacter sp. CPCC 205762]MDR9368004.1 hypothetical protein [Conexibacter sp. JD483]